MTKEQHVYYWMNTAEEDWITVGVLFSMNRYLHSLFWAHFMLEKLAKALWVKHNEDNLPPKSHNIVWILQDSKVELDSDKTNFLAKFGCYQASTRYPDYTDKVYLACNQDFTRQELETVKEIRSCLLKMLP